MKQSYNIILDGYINGDTLVNSAQVFMQRVSDKTTTSYVAKSASFFDPKEAKKLDYEVQVINRIYEALDVSGSSTEGAFGVLTKIADVRECDSGESSASYVSMRIPPVVRTEKLNGTDFPVLLFRDSGLRPLRQLHENTLSIHTATKIVTMVTEALTAIHKAQIAHLNLNPDCLFVGDSSNSLSQMSLELFDFRNALYVGETGSRYTLSADISAHYISPEQSGRMNKKIDGRSDIYSLGIIFWELLTGNHPFEGADKETMIYYHIAKKIPQVDTVNTKVPKVLSAIISKMISKDRSERYQDITALKHDLFEIMPDGYIGENLNDTDFITHLLKFDDFKLATRDKSNLLALKEEAIQRPVESRILQTVFSRDTTKIPLTLVCLKGKAKTGKRSLVNQLEEYAQTLGGTLIDCTTAGNVQNPFIVLIDKISRSILSRTSDKLLSTRNALLQGVGRDDLGMLIQIIPNIQSIMGVNFKTPAVDQFNQSVFSNALKTFLEILLSTISTVLYFPNIIQNEASLEFLKVIISGRKLKCMIIFHYDYQLVDVSNQFCAFAEALLLEGYHSLELQNLTLNEITVYLGSLLIPTNGNLTELAELLYKKCGGNPYYLKELVSFCATNSLFNFDDDIYVWVWNLENLRCKLKITENVANDLVERLNTLPKEIMDILSAASIMGSQFELLHIERTLEDSNFGTHVAKLVEMQYFTDMQLSAVKKKSTSSFNNRHTLFQKSSMYEISSPRIRSAILDSLSREQRGIYCTKLVLMAKVLGLSLAKYQYDDFLIFCNEAIEVIDNAIVIETLFSVNLTLARFSMRSGNFKDALSDFSHANTIMMKKAEMIWAHVPEEAFEMRSEYVRLLLQYNATDLNTIRSIILDLESTQNSRKKQLTVIVLRLRLLELESDYESMASLGKKALSDFNIISYDQERCSYEKSMQQLVLNFATGTPKEVLNNCNVVEVTGESKLMREIMFLNCIALEIIEPGSKKSGFLAQACCYELKNGCSTYSCLFFSALIKEFIKPGNSFDYTMFQWTIEFSMILIEVGERETKNSATLAAMKGMDLIWPPKKMMSSTKEYLEASLQAASFDAIMVIEIIYLYNFSIGTKLSEIGAVIKSYEAKAKDSPLLSYFGAPFATDAIAEQEFEVQKTFKVLPKFIDVVRILLYDGREEKMHSLPIVNSLLEELYTMTAVIDILMIKFLFLMDLIKFESEETILLSYKKDADSILTMLGNYSEIATAKEQRCKILLVNAEDNKRKGKMVEAIALYEECIENAAMCKNIFIQALANEFYGAMLIELQSKLLSKPCLLEAIDLWTKYGCEAKSKQLRTKYAFVLTQQVTLSSKNASKRRNSLWDNVVRNSISVSNITGAKKEEKAAMIELTSSLNQEKNLDILVQKVSRHVITAANATKSVIMLAEKDSLNINAISFLDDNGKIIHDTKVLDAEKDCKVPLKPVFYVWRSGEKLVLNDSLHWDSSFKQDEYLRQYQPKSFLCLPIIYQEGITGVLYLENALQKRAFTTANVELVQSFISAAAVAIENARLQKKNQELANELERKNNMPPKLSFDSPIQKVVESLQTLKTKFEFDPTETTNINTMIQILNSDDLFRADLNFDLDFDSETKKWVESTLLHQEATSSNNSTPTNLPDTSIRIDTEPENMVKSYLELTDPMDFDIFKFSELTNQQPLHYLAMHMFHELRLFDSLKIHQDKASKFFQRIESSYNYLPYHNSIHAADLLKTVRLILFDTPLCSKFTEAELACIIIGGAIHDVDHPGVNNNFLMMLNHPLAVLYNDASVLENHHLALSFEIARESDSNIFMDIDPAVFTGMRKFIIQCVLATDLAMHFQILNKFKAKVAAGNLKMEEANDRSIVTEMAMKCGDLANPTRPLAQSVKWSFKIMEEFFNQGEREKSVGLPVSQFMDQSNTNIPKCQIGFIDFLVAPLYDIWTLFSSTPFTEACAANIASNRDAWKEWQENPSTMPSFPEKPSRKDETLDMKTMSIVKFGSIGVSEKVNYWSMKPHADQPTSRQFGSGLRTVLAGNISGATNLSVPDLNIRGRPSFRKVVQALMANKEPGASSGRTSRLPSITQDSFAARPRSSSAADQKRGSVVGRRISGNLSGPGDRRRHSNVQGIEPPTSEGSIGSISSQK